MRFRGFDVPLRVDREFMITPETLTPGIPDNRVAVDISGAWGAITAQDVHGRATHKDAMQFMRQIRRVDLAESPSGAATVKRAVSLVRLASKHPRYGKLIGRDCLSVVIHPNSRRMPTHYHPENASGTTRLHHLVEPGYTLPGGDFELKPYPGPIR